MDVVCEDDDAVGNMLSSCTKAAIPIRIPEALLIEEIKQTDTYKKGQQLTSYERENVSQVEKAILADEDDQLVEGKEDDEVEKGFVALLLLSQEDPDTRLQPRSHKKSPEEKEDDDHHNEDSLTRKKRTGSSKEKQTPISSPPRSPRIDLSSDKAPDMELTETKVQMSDAPSYSSSTCFKNLKGTHTGTFYPPTCISILDIQKQLYNEMKESPQASATDPEIKRDHDDHLDDPPKGEKGAKKKKTSKESTSTNIKPSSKLIQEFDDDEEISKEATLEFLAELMSNDKRILTIVDIHKMKHGNTEARKYVLSLHKIHATSFPEDNLKEFHGGKMFYIKKHRKERLEPLEVFSNQKFVEVIRVKNEMTYEQDLKEGIVSIITDPFIGIVYENKKKERRVMDIKEFPKLSNATLTNVLKKMKEINVEVRHGFKDPPLSKEDREVIELFEEEIHELLKHMKQMRRWKSYIGGRPILSIKDRPE
ncbi:hypothetical protein Tco_0237177 [Tanacetum coccineum]